MSLCISFVRVKKGLIFQPETIPLNGKSFNLDFHFKQNINMKVRAEENLTGIICRNVLRIRATAFSTKSNPSLRVEDFLSKMIKKFLFFLQETIVMQTSKVFSFFSAPKIFWRLHAPNYNTAKKGRFARSWHHCCPQISLFKIQQNKYRRKVKINVFICISDDCGITAAAYCLQFVAAVQLHSAY